MRIAIISGSHRTNSESERVAHFISGMLQNESVESDIISLANNPLPLWDEGIWNGDPKWKELWTPMSQVLKQADALVVVVPEWAGMAPPGLKNFFLLCSPAEVGHKPTLIVAVSSGVGGSYPIAELRSSSYKNNRLVYIPEHMIIRDVSNMLKQDTTLEPRDVETRKRLSYNLKILCQYGKALREVRESGVLNYSDFPYGL